MDDKDFTEFLEDLMRDAVEARFVEISHRSLVAITDKVESLHARLAASEARVAELEGLLNNQECDTAFWKGRAERMRPVVDAAVEMERVAAYPPDYTREYFEQRCEDLSAAVTEYMAALPDEEVQGE